MIRRTIAAAAIRLYPEEIRRTRGEELIGTLLDAGNASPAAFARQIASLAVAGVAARSRRVSARGWWAFGLTSGGVLWAALIVAGAFIIPAYSSSGADSSGHTWSSTATLIQVNGAGVLVPVSVPLALAALVWLVLHRRCARGSRARFAWVLIGLLWAFAVLTGFSIGFLVLPVAGLLTAGARITPNGADVLAQA